MILHFSVVQVKLKEYLAVISVLPDVVTKKKMSKYSSKKTELLKVLKEENDTLKN